jgi:hypothetical protein
VTFPKIVPLIGLVVAITAFLATPLHARTSYAGVGATLASFEAAHPNGPGKPHTGVTYFRATLTHNGRVWVYHVVVGWKTKRDPTKVFSLLARDLPPDAKAVKPYDGYCAVYRSSWLGRITGLPYIVLYAPHSKWWSNAATVSRAGKCRG